jgi:dipeptidase E
MPKVYFLGGEDVNRRDARKVNERAFQDAGNNPEVLVFSWAKTSFDRGYEKRKRLFDYFKCLGANTVSFAEYSDSRGNVDQRMTESNVIYLTGGVTSVLVERLKNLRVDKLLRRYDGVVVGRSAGALALCRRCVITCRNSSRMKVVNGLDLVDFTLKVHYKSSKDKDLERLSKKQKIFAVAERSALVYHNGALSFIGDVVLFDNGEKRILSKSLK